MGDRMHFCDASMIDIAEQEWRCTSIIDYGHQELTHVARWRSIKGGKPEPTLKWPITESQRILIDIEKELIDESRNR